MGPLFWNQYVHFQVGYPECEGKSAMSWANAAFFFTYKMVFMGYGFTSGGQIQASKHYIESVPLVPKDRSTVQYLGIHYHNHSNR